MSEEAPENPPLPDAPLPRLLAIMARLRTPGTGCPWDLEQSFATIAPYTIEEAYEVADAIRRGDLGALKEELGDLLLQVVFHARMAEEAQAFRFEDVAAAINAKLIDRHPHVFGGLKLASAEAQTMNWEALKAGERAAKGQTSALDGVALALPALMRAEKLQRRAARVGFDWPAPEPVYAKLAEEIEELRTAATAEAQREEAGDLLFSVVNLLRHLKIDAETALSEANGKFERRFRKVERLAADRGLDMGDAAIEALDALWEEAKRTERGGIAGHTSEGNAG